jgi:hypothetical protein
MKHAILSAALAVAFVAGPSAQDKPNFAGTWEMDRARSSQFAAGAPAVITVEGAKMTVTRTMAGNSSSLVFMLDGTPSKNIRCEGCEPVILTSKWEGNVLVTPIGPSRIEKYSIQEDGTLKMEITLTSKNETGVLVFKRVK